MKILFVYVSVTLPGWDSHGKSNNEACYTSHGYMSLSAVLKMRGHQVSLLDMRDCKGWGDFERKIQEAEYDVAGIGFISADLDTARIACSIIKKVHPSRVTVAGGLHLSATDTRTFPYVDCVIHGEGEIALAEWIEDLDYDRITPTAFGVPAFVRADPIEDLDSLPFVDRTLFDWEAERRNPLLPGLPAPNVTILTSRGCQFRCSYCNPSGKAVFGPGLRMRSPGNVIEELKEIEKEKGAHGSIMLHSDVLGTPEWIQEFLVLYANTYSYLPFWCQLRSDFIVKHPDLVGYMAQVGMLWCSVGFESGSDRVLKFIHKGTTREMNLEAAEILHKNGVNIFANLIIGLPTETESEMMETLTMAQAIRPAWWSANPFASFPGSDLYNYCVEHDLLTDQFYAKNVYPYQRKIQGINYEAAMNIAAEVRRHTRPVLYAKKKIPGCRV